MEIKKLKYNEIEFEGRILKIRGLRYMKRLGAYRCNGLYYYPNAPEYSLIDRIYKKLNGKWDDEMKGGSK